MCRGGGAALRTAALDEHTWQHKVAVRARCDASLDPRRPTTAVVIHVHGAVPLHSSNDINVAVTCRQKHAAIPHLYHKLQKANALHGSCLAVASVLMCVGGLGILRIKTLKYVAGPYCSCQRLLRMRYWRERWSPVASHASRRFALQPHCRAGSSDTRILPNSRNLRQFQSTQQAQQSRMDKQFKRRGGWVVVSK